ncbi:MAG TPA: hypothetical protein VHW74_02875 [Mycobacteriales bacterium]|nr:hypothetical protein [Mycobacteriales bacterium]
MSRKQLPDDGEERRPDDPAIVELLDSVREARTSLAIELSAAAGAIEAGHPEVARDIVAATAEEMRLVGERQPVALSTTVPPQRRRSRRSLLALPAIPLVGAIAMTAASALSSGAPARHHATVNTPHVAVAALSPQRAGTTALDPIAHDVARTTLHRLEHVVTHHPHAAQVIAVADDLHDQLTAMIATATNDPARLHVVRQLLMLEQHVLESVKVPGTQLALAASRAIARLLDLEPTTHVTPSPKVATSSKPATPQPTATASATTPTSVHTQSPPSPSVPTAHTPGDTSKNTLFGRGLFNRH